MNRVRANARRGTAPDRLRRLRGQLVIGFAGLLVALALAWAWATQAAAQHAGDMSSAPPPPPGNGSLTVQIKHPDGSAQTAGIAIALYALPQNGSPGFAGGETNAEGIFKFAGISPDPDIVYLVGARYKEIPFGVRVTFAAGQTEVEVELEVSEPTDEITGVHLDEVRVRIDWMGDRLVVREVLRLTSAGPRVIRLTDGEQARSIVRSIVTRRLGPRATDFSAGTSSIGDGLSLENGAVRFRGPLYPGEQRVEYQYSLPIPSDGSPLRVPVELAEAAARVVVVAGTAGLGVRGSKLIASSEIREDVGQSFAAWARAGLAAGEVLSIDLDLPETRLDASLLSIPRSDVWIEVDDIQLTARLDVQLQVEPGAPLAGTPDAPLLRVSIPAGATLQGVAPEAESLGLIPRDEGGFDIVGPIGPDTTSLGYSYRMPARTEGIDLDMRFPGAVETLNVLVADTGLALESSRLHNRRPFRSGTRNYLHREAFNVGADEIIDLELVPIGTTDLPRNASIALAIAAAAAGAFFLAAPLRTASRSESEEESPQSQIQAERKAIYTAIRDLDHDFETAKLEASDYTQLREELRTQAIDLLRAERDATDSARPPQVTDQSAAAPSRPHAHSVGAPAAATGRYCPSCGKGVAASWRFCSHCGGVLNPAEESGG